ncbi:hypothetical protein DIPPA_29173, partial [Diplonema papillatum]
QRLLSFVGSVGTRAGVRSEEERVAGGGDGADFPHPLRLEPGGGATWLAAAASSPQAAVLLRDVQRAASMSWFEVPFRQQLLIDRGGQLMREKRKCAESFRWVFGLVRLRTCAEANSAIRSIPIPAAAFSFVWCWIRLSLTV